MTDNAGNAYRTRQAVTVCALIIALAVAILLVGAADVSITVAAGAFLLIAGVFGAGISFAYSPAPDKFGPSERSYRLIAGLVTVVIGASVLMIGYEVELYIIAAAFLIGIAAIGICATLIGNKTSKY